MFAAYSSSWWITVGALGVVLVVGVAVAVFLLAGLFQARSLLRRELAAYFTSPIAYLVLVVFLLVTGYSFMKTVGSLAADGPHGGEYPMQSFLSDWRIWLVLLVIPPLLTMRLFAEERGTGTLEMLLTSPLREWQIVLAKFLACYLFYIFMWVPTLVYLPMLAILGEPVWQPVWTVWSILFLAGLSAVLAAVVLAWLPLNNSARLVGLVLFLAGVAAAVVGGWAHYHYDTEHLLTIPAGIDPMPVVSSYLGLFLAGAMFLALGLLISSLVRSQLVAFLLSLAFSLLFIVAGFFQLDLYPTNPWTQAAFFFSVPLHFQRDFCRGLVDTRPLLLYSSVSVFCLFLTVRSLESRRWR